MCLGSAGQCECTVSSSSLKAATVLLLGGGAHLPSSKVAVASMGLLSLVPLLEVVQVWADGPAINCCPERRFRIWHNWQKQLVCGSSSCSHPSHPLPTPRMPPPIPSSVFLRACAGTERPAQAPSPAGFCLQLSPRPKSSLWHFCNTLGQHKVLIEVFFRIVFTVSRVVFHIVSWTEFLSHADICTASFSYYNQNKKSVNIPYIL